MFRNASFQLLQYSLRRFIVGLMLGSMVVGAGAAPADVGDRRPAAATGKPETFKKFVTDEALRQGMASIATTIGNSSKDVQENRLTGPTYVEMARQIESQIASIVKNCKLDKRADHTLHEIIFDLNQSIGMMRQAKQEVQRAGALAATQALRNYAKYFDDPGWTGPQ